MLKDLIKLANHLDKIGNSKEADDLDKIISKVAQMKKNLPLEMFGEQIDSARSKILAIKTYFDYDHNPFEQPLDEGDINTVYGRSSMLLKSLDKLKRRITGDQSPVIMTPADEADANKIGQEKDAYETINLAMGAMEILRGASTFVGTHPYAFMEAGGADSLSRDLMMLASVAEEISNMIYDRYHAFNVGGKDSYRFVGDSGTLRDAEVANTWAQANRKRNKMNYLMNS